MACSSVKLGSVPFVLAFLLAESSPKKVSASKRADAIAKQGAMPSEMNHGKGPATGSKSGEIGDRPAVIHGNLSRSALSPFGSTRAKRELRQ
jgi:hypothetical protein